VSEILIPIHPNAATHVGADVANIAGAIMGGVATTTDS
jgi:hypothetical protein